MHPQPGPSLPADPAERPLLAPVWRGGERAEADRLALVLAAVGIPAMIALSAEGWVLLVPAGQADPARAQLEAYAAENAAPAPASPPAGRPAAADPTTGLLAAAAILFFLDAAAGRGLSGVDWWGAGIADAGAILGGELWRAVTALGLHSGFDHLGGNLLFGALFVGLLAGETGTGLAFLLVLLGGTAGNLANAVLRGAGHASVGASTAVFAALGILAVRGWLGRRDLSGLRRLAPLGGGILLLAWLGFSGERTDIGAHVLGFASGALLALPLARLPAHVTASRRVQTACAGAALALFALAWAVALLVSG
jgi:membrane associated rhomboid family serine protease